MCAVWCLDVPWVAVAPLKESGRMDRKRVDRFRAGIALQIAELQKAVRTGKLEAHASQGKPADDADKAALSHERELLLLKNAQDRQLLKNLQRALSRVQDGSFGQCLACGGEINPKRLEALPWA